MGTWLNVAFVESDDPQRVARALEALVVERGRTIVRAKPRKPKSMDPMQYGSGDEVRRWALAVFAGAPGWTVVRTAPLELLLQATNGNAPLLVELCRRLGVRGFQFNVYDGDSQLLYEVERDGRIEVSGYSSMDPERYHEHELTEDRFEARFRIVDVEPAAAASMHAAPELRVGDLVPPAPSAPELSPEFAAELGARRTQLLAWVEAHGEIRKGQSAQWRVHPAEVVRALSSGADFLSIEGVTDAAIRHVFGGANARHCDNGLLVETLIPHEPLPIQGVVLFADR